MTTFQLMLDTGIIAACSIPPFIFWAVIFGNDEDGDPIIDYEFLPKWVAVVVASLVTIFFTGAASAGISIVSWIFS